MASTAAKVYAKVDVIYKHTKTVYDLLKYEKKSLDNLHTQLKTFGKSGAWQGTRAVNWYTVSLRNLCNEYIDGINEGAQALIQICEHTTKNIISKNMNIKSQSNAAELLEKQFIELNKDFEYLKRDLNALISSSTNKAAAVATKL